MIRDAEDVIEALSGPRTLGLAEPGQEFLFGDDDTFDDDFGEFSYDTIEDFDGDNRTVAVLADQILRLLGSQAVEEDEISRQCGASPSEFSLAVLELDLAGHIDLLPG